MTDTASATENAKEYLNKILSILEIEGKILEESFDESTVSLRIDCPENDARFLIGKHGQTLEYLQFLVRQMSKGAENSESFFVVDVMDYRTRRKESLIDRAKRGAVAVLNGEYERYNLPPMSAFERRMIHKYLQENFPDLATHSQGRMDSRHIVISYAGLPEENEGEEAPVEAVEEDSSEAQSEE